METTVKQNPIAKRMEELGLTLDGLRKRLEREGVSVSVATIDRWKRSLVKVPGVHLPALDRALGLLEGSLYRELYAKNFYGGKDE